MCTAWDRRCWKYCIKLNEFEYVRRCSLPWIGNCKNCRHHHHHRLGFVVSFLRFGEDNEVRCCARVWGREWNEVGLGTDCDLAEDRAVNLIESNDRADVKLKLAFVVF